MREAQFVGIFVGIGPRGRCAQGHAQGAERRAADDAVDHTINDYGWKSPPASFSGWIMIRPIPKPGSDFIELSQIPMLTINLLQALPKTPLWDRLHRRAPRRRSQAREQCLLRPLSVVAMWHRRSLTPTIRAAVQRFRHQVDATVNRFAGTRARQAHLVHLSKAAVMFRIVVHLGYWRTIAGRSAGDLPRLAARQIDGRSASASFII
jgi:hypothetical protein